MFFLSRRERKCVSQVQVANVQDASTPPLYRTAHQFGSFAAFDRSQDSISRAGLRSIKMIKTETSQGEVPVSTPGQTMWF
jgi:hypothetical protein